ncbi:hypothetical protein DPMN_006595 [Dreissena polymorpha]|uniref:Uncharacterized protein n=1 Tax=Dreissena polymorpha TaxID=45954 RepID=A0A9D4MUB0_DREPO|nr:hypothetical protein DPMN_006595 [Dreissena polymorpha]
MRRLRKCLKRTRKKANVNNSCTRAPKVKVQKEYTEANSRVKRSIRVDKQNFLRTLATEAKKAAYQ